MVSAGCGSEVYYETLVFFRWRNAIEVNKSGESEACLYVVQGEEWAADGGKNRQSRA